MQILSKTSCREYSLFYCTAWCMGDTQFMQEWLGFNFDILFYKEPQVHTMCAWYNPTQIQSAIQAIHNRVRQNPLYTKQVIHAFHLYWDKVIPYVAHNKPIHNTEELQRYFDNLMRCWAPYTVLYYIPEVERLPQQQKDSARQAIQESEQFSVHIDRCYSNFMRSAFPEYESIHRVLLPAEIMRLPSLSEQEVERIRERCHSWALCNNELLPIQQLEQQLAQRGYTIEQTQSIHTNKLKGKVAYAGNVRGSVRRILHASEIEQLQQGEVLVARMTSPEYVVAMKRAVAIVTDEGGITSHAAIVARELRIPCIIGTQSATKCLQTGDRVEVDAHNGYVHLLDQQNNN